MKNPTQHAYIATLPCDTLMSAKQAGVATYLRCGRGKVVNNQIRKGLLLSLRVKIFLKPTIIWQITSKNVIVSCTFSVL